MTATVADCRRLQTDWFAYRAEALGRPDWTDAGHRWIHGGDDLHLLFPERPDADAIARGLARAAELEVSSVGVWLDEDVDASALEAHGFREGWQPWWMAGDLASMSLTERDGVELQTVARPGDFTGQYAAYAQELALTRTDPRRAWYAAAYDGGRFAGHAWAILDGSVAGVFDVATWEPFRRRGFGAATTSAVLRAAGEAGATEVVLNATPMGALLYESLGMRRIGEGRTWWRRLRRALEDGRPSRTAFGAAAHRAVHQELEAGAIFGDPLAWSLLGGDRAAIVAKARSEGRDLLRRFIALRHRFAEDGLAAAVARGTDQAVILGAGLDTLAYRNPHEGLRIFEVDHPATARWKQHRLTEAGVTIPESVTYVGVDFESDDLRARLAESGVDLGRPAYFLWLGVVPYLTREAVVATLAVVASIPDGEITFDYASPVASLDEASRAMRGALADRVAAIGEPLRSEYAVDELEALLTQLGFDEIEDAARDGYLTRTFGVTPTTSPSGRAGHVVRARRTSLD